MSEQNIQFSDDENCLIVRGGRLEGQYNAVKSGPITCNDCNFLQRNLACALGGISTSKCTPPRRLDGQAIIWIKKEAEMTEAPAPAPAPAPALQHRHFDLIVQWAKNPTQPVWFWNVDEWQKAVHLMWHMEHYAIGEKPTMPPIKMVKYDGGSIEFPKPARVELERDTHYWAATICGADHDYWTGHSSDFELLDSGLIQLTKEGAEKQSEALVELLKNHAQKWG